MRTYQSNISSRLDPLFAELAMMGMTPAARRLQEEHRPFHTIPKSNATEKARRERERAKKPNRRVPMPSYED